MELKRLSPNTLNLDRAIHQVFGETHFTPVDAGNASTKVIIIKNM